MCQIVEECGVYNVAERLPDDGFVCCVCVVGSMNLSFLYLLGWGVAWFVGVWMWVSDNVEARNCMLRVCDWNDIVYPFGHVCCSFVDENSVLVALEFGRAVEWWV